MSNIDTWFVRQWDAAIRVEASQKESRLMKTVTDRGTIEGSSFTINNLADDGRKLTQNTTRYGDTEFTLSDQSSRLGVMKDFFEAIPLDRADVPKMKVNPVTGGAYMGILMARKNRTIDDIIYRAARDTIRTQEGSAIDLPNTQKIAVGGTAFTKAKLIAARKIFRRNEADHFAGEGHPTILYNDEILEDILSDTTLTNADYMAVKMLQDGDLSGKWMGFNWEPYNAIDKVGTDYFTVAYTKSAIHFGKGFEEGKVSQRPDKKDLTQVSMAASYGAGRQDEKKVVEIGFL